LDFTNNIFEQIMSENVGELNYTKEEFLNYGASYLEEDLPIEINILTDEKEELEEVEEPIDNIEAESILVANKIEELLKSDIKIYDKKIGEYRKIQEKDIAILLRTTKNYSNVFLSELSKRNISAYSDSEESYLNSIEVNTIISILKIIDNPMQDIPLIATLRCGFLGKFTDNELIEIRLIDKRCSFFEALMKKQINKDGALCEKINTFLEKLTKFQEMSQYLKISELIWQILSQTGFLSYVSLMPDGQKRGKNLKLLFEKAAQYEKTNLKGLFNFIKFIDKLVLSSKDTSSAKLISENDNVVRIMSIHKSKGLEFPVVIFSGVGKKFNLQDLKEKLLIHAEVGLGPEYINCDKGISYSTLAKEAIKEKMKLELLSEEMRLLYVALTRAKEKLIITGIKKNTKVTKIQNKISQYKISTCTNFLSWLELTLKEQKTNYYNMADLNKNENVQISTKELPELSENNIEFEQVFNKKDNQELYIIPTKASASSIDNSYNEENIILHDRPEFLKDISKYKSGAEKGTQIHRILEMLPFKKYSSLEELKKEILKTTKEDVDAGKIYNFTKSNLYERMIMSKKIEKEKAFCMLMSCNEIYTNISSNENIIVQGIIDCYFEDNDGKIILIDYKTDYIGENIEQFVLKYKKQLIIYKKALQKATNKEVKEIYLYSFSKNTAIEILQYYTNITSALQ